MKQKKSKKKHTGKAMNHDFIKDMTTWTGVALFTTLPECGNVKITLREKGYKRHFVIRKADEVLEIRIHATGDVDLLYSDKSYGSFINPCYAYEHYLQNRVVFRDVYTRRLLAVFTSFLGGTLYDIIEESVSSQESDEDTEETEKAQIP